jgi:uncharacterized metal-binding protein
MLIIGSFSKKDSSGSLEMLIVAAIIWLGMMLLYSLITAIVTRIWDIQLKRRYMSNSRLWKDKAFMASIFLVAAIYWGTYNYIFAYEWFYYVRAFLVFSLVYTCRRSYLFKMPNKDADIYMTGMQ